MPIVPHVIHAGEPLSRPAPVKSVGRSPQSLLRRQQCHEANKASGKLDRDVNELPRPTGHADQSNYIAYLNFLRNLESEQREREASHRRRVSVKAAGPMFTLQEWLNLCERHDNCCARCKKPEPLTVDHIQPVSKGGSNAIENIQPLCGSCNSSKGTDNTDYRL